MQLQKKNLRESGISSSKLIENLSIKDMQKIIGIIFISLFFLYD